MPDGGGNALSAWADALLPVLTQDITMQQPRTLMTFKFPPFIAELCCSGGPFLDGYVLVIIGVALEQLTLLQSLMNGLARSARLRLPDCLSAPRCLAYICDKVGRRKMFLLLILSLSARSPWRPCLFPRR